MLQWGGIFEIYLRVLSAMEKGGIRVFKRLELCEDVESRSGWQCMKGGGSM